MSKDKACITAIEEVCKRCNLYKENCGMLDFPSQCVHSGHFIDGYRKAEKDLELTWKDMELIYEISCDVFNEQDGCFYDVSKIWEEVLKRFKERKEK